MALIGLRLLSGVMGGGKSYYMAEIILHALKEGAQVHTNVDLVQEEVVKRGYAAQVVDLRNIDIKHMKDHIRAGDEKHPNILCLDEAALHFYVDDQNDRGEREANKEVLQFLTWARRYGLEVYFATQSPKNINIKLRRMSEYTIRCRNVTQTPYFGWLLTLWGGEFRRTFYLTDEDKEVELYTTKQRFSLEVGSFYDTVGFAGLQEKQGVTLNKVITRRVPKRIDQRNGKIAIALFICTGVLALMGMAYLFRGWTNPMIDKKGKQQISTAKVSTETIQFVSMNPKILLVTDAKRVYYTGAALDGKTITKLNKYGQGFLVTYEDKTTQTLYPKL